MDQNLRNDLTIVVELLLPECGTQEATALLLFYLYGRKGAAQIMGITQNSIRDYVYRARGKVKNLHECDVEILLIKRLIQKLG
jgi:DNA-directed RNA polymerase specialized sigma24 family protein